MCREFKKKQKKEKKKQKKKRNSVFIYIEVIPHYRVFIWDSFDREVENRYIFS